MNQDKEQQRIHYQNGDYTLEEIARYFGISKERVRQIEKAAIRKLKRPEVAKKLREYLEE